MVATVVVAGLIVYIMSLQNADSGEARLDGLVTLDGNPLGGARIDFRGEEQAIAPSTGQKSRSTGITRYINPARSDADGRYSVKLRPGINYTISVHRDDLGKQPLTATGGRLPSVTPTAGHHRLDIPLASR
jgi:hypothetical protein